MTGFLSQNKIDYLLFHLNHAWKLTAEIKDKMLFHSGNEIPKETGRIVFLLTEKEFDSERITTVDRIPVLFPASIKKEFYQMIEGNLVFHHDLLKSAFYLLSGFQELHPEYLDPLGRYPYKSSVQHSLDMAGKPLVNYYFKIIAEGISEFCQWNGIPFQKRLMFNNFASFLTHDVDRVDTYTIYATIFRLKQFLGLSRSTVTRFRSFRIAVHYLIQWMNPFNRKNPHWDFPFLRAVEEKYGFKSAFYFLPKDQIHVDAYYSFGERRIRDLIETLDKQECELGLHGTVRSHTSARSLQSDLDYFENYSLRTAQGIRQHRLMFDRNITPGIHQAAGLKYDTSLGFAEHEGFRNSYCLPFRMYDHVSDQMMDLWEIPLTVMDGTLFHYRKHSMQEALSSVNELLNEISKFNGVFVLLWHNGQNDEFLQPGITKFYLDLMQMIAEKDPERLLGYQIIERFKNE